MAVRSYFAIDEALLAEQLVPVTFASGAFLLGKDLDSARNADGERTSDLLPGAKATLPLWAAAPLRKSGFVSVQSPAIFLLSTFKEFKPDAMVPQLSTKSPYFYSVGLWLSSMLPPNEGLRLRQQLLRLFQSRYYGVVASAGKHGFDFADTRLALCEAERGLLDSVQSALPLTTGFHTFSRTQ
jgi:hypothetical protein